MAIDTSKIPNTETFEEVRKALVDLESQIDGFTGGTGVDADTLDGNDSAYYLNYNNLNNTPTIPSTTDEITEGSRLYYTNARADARVNLQTGTNLDLSQKTTDDLSVGNTNLYYTESLFDTSFGAKDTGDLAEDANATVTSGTMYYTDARVQTKIDSYVDGAFISGLSGVDADTLNGEEGGYYLNYANFYGNNSVTYNSSGQRIARGIIYYVGTQTTESGINGEKPTGLSTFNFDTGVINFQSNADKWSQIPPTSNATFGETVYISRWSCVDVAQRYIAFEDVTSSTSFEGVVTFSNLKDSGFSVIDGGNISTGSISSTGFTAGANPNDFSVSGTTFFLTGGSDNSAGDIISPQFKITSGDAEFKGSLASTSGSIGGWDIEADAIVSPDDRVELNKDSGLQIKNSSGTPKVQIRSGALTGVTSKTFTFSGLSTLEFNTFNDTLTSNSEDFLYNGTTSLSTLASISSSNYGVYVEQISMNATPVGQTVFTTSSDFIGNVNVEVRMDIATDSSFSNILKTVVLQTAGTSSAGVDVDFVADARNIEININQNFTTAYMRVYYYRNVFVGAGSVDFDTGSALTSFDFGQTNAAFAKTINQTELTDEGFQVIYDSNNYLKTSTVSASSEFVEIEGGLNLDGVALNVQNYASRTAAHSDSATANFYQRLSDTCIMQWGYVNGNNATPTTFFPLTFPKSCRSVHVSTRRTSSSGNGTNYVYSVTASSFAAVIEDSNGQGRDFFWIAFGD
jgi:hypothetical protein